MQFLNVVDTFSLSDKSFFHFSHSNNNNHGVKGEFRAWLHNMENTTTPFWQQEAFA
jgi:hypothetical protein